MTNKREISQAWVRHHLEAATMHFEAAAGHAEEYEDRDVRALLDQTNAAAKQVLDKLKPSP